MVDALFHMQENAVHAASMTDGEFVPMRQGRHYQPLSPAGTFKAPQGWIVILCTQGQIGLPVGGAGPARAGARTPASPRTRAGSSTATS